ncbi:MAG: FAD-dependent oxidoreductase [Ilumatobacteraceae bacterium]
MTEPTFSHLLAPGRINGLTLANRVVLPGMDTNHCEDGVVTDAEIRHYARRAEGGAGLIITGASAVAWPLGATSRKQPALSDDRFVPGLTALADAIHAAGSRLCVQLVHHGKVASVDIAEDRPQLVPSVPPSGMDLSALADNTMDELIRLANATAGKPATYRVATSDDIAWVIESFADAASRVQRAGADAVEVHGAHGYLINGFLSRAYNQRTDEYGGDLVNRSRLLVEVLGAVRARVGPDFPILVRLNGREYGLDDGITIEETVATALIAEQAGADAIHVSGQAANPFRDFTLGPIPSQLGQYREMAAAVKRVVSVPVIAVGRLLPEMAEEMIANAECDFVSMGRQQLADPQLVSKLAAGQHQSIRPCINCYVCVEQNFFDRSPVCAVNPELGASDEAIASEPVTVPRHIVVVGGGPAGLETARVVANRGHHVTVLERSAQVGGSTWFATLSGSSNQTLIDWLVHETDRPEIERQCNTEATVEVIAALHPDAVVIATGTTLLRVDGGDGADGVDARDTIVALAGASEPTRVTVVGGSMIGLSLADFLRTCGHDVSLREAGKHFGLGMAMPRRWTAVAAAADKGVTLVRSTDDIPTPADGVGDPDRVDGVVITVDIANDTEPPLAADLRRLGYEVSVIGDAGGVGYLQGAIHGANIVANQL